MATVLITINQEEFLRYQVVACPLYSLVKSSLLGCHHFFMRTHSHDFVTYESFNEHNVYEDKRRPKEDIR